MSAAITFRPSLKATLIALPLLLTLLGLGTWQVERLHWKTALIADMRSRLAMPPEALIDLLPLGPAANYRPVYVVGVYRHDHEMQLQARTYDGQIGVQLVTPVQLIESRSREDAGSGVPSRVDAVLVNRGWVPLDRRDPRARLDSWTMGEVVLTGILRWPTEPGRFTPENRPDKGEWYWLDLPAMAAQSDLPRVAPAYIELGRSSSDPDRLPVGGQTIVELPNNHLQYAITWYALAAVLLATYILSQRRPPDAEPKVP